MERTLAIIKPDAVENKYSGKIIDQIEQKGFNIIALEKKRLPREDAEYFYEVHHEKKFFGEIINFMISGPIIVMVLEKEDAIRAWRDLMGATDPEKAADGTLRSMYAQSIGQNAVHGSDSPDTAQREISFFFPDVL